MSEEEYLYYSESIQYLGKRGITRPCVMAMAAILTSAFQPKEITAVVGSWKERGSYGGTEPVLFLVWDWYYPTITIIPDGFGTHSGEGGRGLSTVLGLIKYYKVPLRQLWVYEKQAFQELAEGRLSEAMFGELQHDVRDYHWNFHPVSSVRKVKRGTHQFLEVDPANENIELTIRLP